MRNPIIFMFSGQGSQYYHMGRELYGESPVFKRWMDKLNQFVYQNTGLSIIDEVYNGKRTKADKFDQLSYTHPAIFMIEYSLSRVLIESGIEPDFVLGASLGEFTAAAVAGAVPVEETLECLLKQAELFQKTCNNGFMIAIVGNTDLYHQTSAIYLNSELASVNYSSHFVISGNVEKLSYLENYLKDQQLIFLTLPVKYGFHSSNIDPAGNEFKRLFGRYSLKELQVPMISCLLGGRIASMDAGYCWEVVRQPIRFQTTILKLENDHRFDYIDVGPSGTLANFVKNNIKKDSNSRIHDILTPFGQDLKKLARLKENLQ